MICINSRLTYFFSIFLSSLHVHWCCIPYWWLFIWWVKLQFKFSVCFNWFSVDKEVFNDWIFYQPYMFWNLPFTFQITKLLKLFIDFSDHLSYIFWAWLNLTLLDQDLYRIKSPWMKFKWMGIKTVLKSDTLIFQWIWEKWESSVGLSSSFHFLHLSLNFLSTFGTVSDIGFGWPNSQLGTDVEKIKKFNTISSQLSLKFRGSFPKFWLQ